MKQNNWKPIENSSFLRIEKLRQQHIISGGFAIAFGKVVKILDSEIVHEEPLSKVTRTTLCKVTDFDKELTTGKSNLLGIYSLNTGNIIDPSQWQYFIKNIQLFYNISNGTSSYEPRYSWMNEKGDVEKILLPTKTATVFFKGDHSVGINDWNYDIQIPDFTNGFSTSDLDIWSLKIDQEQNRTKIQELYELMSGERCYVAFDYEIYQEYLMDLEMSQRTED